MRERIQILAALFCITLESWNCSVGDGEGWITIEGILPECGIEDGEEVDLRVNFFSGEIMEDGSMWIRIQRSGYYPSSTDGIIIYISDYRYVAEHLNETLIVGCDDYPPEEFSGEDDTCVKPKEAPIFIRASLYLNATCDNFYRLQLTEGVGTIIFNSMYVIDKVELIEGSFSLRFIGEGKELKAQGYFKFDYKVGRPAQPFP